MTSPHANVVCVVDVGKYGIKHEYVGEIAVSQLKRGGL